LFGLIFRILGLVGFFVTAAFLAAIAAVGYLAFAGAGSPPSCASTAGSAVQAAAATVRFDATLAAFLATGGRAPVTSASFSESETSARAQAYFDGRTDRVSDVAVCFEDGEASGFLRVETLFGRKLGVGGRGALDLSGEHPRLRLASASVAGIPLPGFLRRQVQDRVDDELGGIDLGLRLALTFRQDEATLALAP
jgi:hypothetical protein